MHGHLNVKLIIQQNDNEHSDSYQENKCIYHKFQEGNDGYIFIFFKNTL